MNNALQDRFEELLVGSRYYFLPMDDLTIIDNLAKTKRIQCYNLSKEETLLGVILDVSDVDLPLVIPVVYMSVEKKGDEIEALSKEYRLEPDETMLLRLSAAVRIANHIQLDTNSYMKNHQKNAEKTDAAPLLKNAEKYVILAKNSEENFFSTENILAIGHSSLLTEKIGDSNQYNVIATTKIMPGHGISVSSYGSTLHLLNQTTLLESERFEIEKYRAKGQDLQGILCKKGEENISVPYNYTWDGQNFIESSTENMCIWDSTILKPQKYETYCFATKSVVKVPLLDKKINLEEVVELKFDNIILKNSLFGKYSKIRGSDN